MWKSSNRQLMCRKCHHCLTSRTRKSSWHRRRHRSVATVSRQQAGRRSNLISPVPQQCLKTRSDLRPRQKQKQKQKQKQRTRVTGPRSAPPRIPVRKAMARRRRRRLVPRWWRLRFRRCPSPSRLCRGGPRLKAMNRFIWYSLRPSGMPIPPANRQRCSSASTGRVLAASTLAR